MICATHNRRSRIRIYGVPGTYSSVPKSKWATLAYLAVIAGGNGGGSGRRGAAGTDRSGGGGGAGAHLSWRLLAATELPATFDVVVGAGGAGGAAVATDDTNGNNGSNGGNSRIGPTSGGYNYAVLAGAGTYGGGGTTTGGQWGAPADHYGRETGRGGGQGKTGTGEHVIGPTSGGAQGGAGAGGVNASNVASAGGDSGRQPWSWQVCAGGTAPGGAGTNAYHHDPPTVGGHGGAGGAGHDAGAGGAGGDGGRPGGGGGGGGASVNGYASGAGGDGADGMALIMEIP